MSEEIENIISLTGGMNVEGEEEWESNKQVALKFKEGSLVGRVLARRHCTVNVFKTVFSRIWEKEGGWFVDILAKEKGCTILGLSFDDKILAAKVYKKSTWIFHGEILITEKWPPNGNWKEASLNMVECWIKMKGFPPNALTLNNVKRLGNMLGEVSDIQWLNTNVMLMRDTVRVKIKFPTSKGAFVGRYIPNNGGQTWIQFKFESLPLHHRWEEEGNNGVQKPRSEEASVVPPITQQVLYKGEECQFHGDNTRRKTSKAEGVGGSRDGYVGRVSVEEIFSKEQSTLTTLESSAENGDRRNFNEVDPSQHEEGQVDKMQLSHHREGEVDISERHVVDSKREEIASDLSDVTEFVTQKKSIPSLSKSTKKGEKREGRSVISHRSKERDEEASADHSKKRPTKEREAASDMEIDDEPGGKRANCEIEMERTMESQVSSLP
ncbi:hypothetical protein G4B88_030375 [Cannabis sativa]|uniref:DUF4283 domain-containing protein n=1 Tax=Cannabis sativa TaxID=3483 RepID=A0A7J6E234_CANSA|nr:hypothetical protein G4B88_030375 [Cannabis sativa]